MLKITKKQRRPDGFVYKVSVNSKVFEIILTYHALARIAVWELELNKVIAALLSPEEVVIGHGGRFIAHRRKGKHIFRIVYEYEGELVKVITVYYPYAKRYWQGGGKFADKIFS